MPSDSGRASRKKPNSGAGKGDVSPEQSELARRSTAFGILVVALAGVALWFVTTAVRGHGNYALSATARYTVKLAEVEARDRGAAEALRRNSTVQSLVQGHQLHLQELPGGRVALCAGAFQSSDSPEARELLEQVRAFRLDGRQVFAGAGIWSYADE